MSKEVIQVAEAKERLDAFIEAMRELAREKIYIDLGINNGRDGSVPAVVSFMATKELVKIVPPTKQDN